jgi:predicted AAA+ superfamily ATPase
MDIKQIAECTQEQEITNQVEELAKKSAFLLEELKRAKHNVKTLQCNLAQCNEELISLAIRNDNRCAAIRLANMMSTQTLIFVIAKSVISRQALESSLLISSPEQEQEQEIKVMISWYTEQIVLYYQVYRSKEPTY